MGDLGAIIMLESGNDGVGACSDDVSNSCLGTNILDMLGVVFGMGRGVESEDARAREKLL